VTFCAQAPAVSYLIVPTQPNGAAGVALFGFRGAVALSSAVAPSLRSAFEAKPTSTSRQGLAGLVGSDPQQT
jgi:hypothetical protein